MDGTRVVPAAYFLFFLGLRLNSGINRVRSLTLRSSGLGPIVLY